jgi:hypothetical protein
LLITDISTSAIEIILNLDQTAATNYSTISKTMMSYWKQAFILDLEQILRIVVVDFAGGLYLFDWKYDE